MSFSLLNLFYFATAALLTAEPLVDSWLTERSGAYAKAYPDNAAETAGTPSTTWPHPNGGIGQSSPTYAGVHEIASTDDHVYICTSGLGYHIMGPWYNNVAQTTFTPSFPENQAVVYRFNKKQEAVTNNSWNATSLGSIGYFVDGVSIFDSRDAFGYVNESNSETAFNQSDGLWSRDAYVNEFLSFDSSNSHQAGGRYHSHANPLGLRYQLGDSVSYDTASNTYTESFNGSHSPIIGWMNDGYPLYGPYGYSDPTDSASPIKRMESGYQLRTLSSGAARDTLPKWSADLLGKTLLLTSDKYGPAVDSAIGSDKAILGRYIEDYEFKGDFGMTQGNDFDLDHHNGRVCKTPEFPNGIYAYFVSIAADGTPQFPYACGPVFCGKVTAESVDNIPLAATTHFKGGPSVGAKNPQLEVSPSDITLSWDASEGGNYQIEKSTNLKDWNPLSTVTSQSESSEIIASKGADTHAFYRVTPQELSDFDVAGFNFRTNTTSTDTSRFPVVEKPNILIILLDDWGIDSSPWDNPSATRHATMSNIGALVNQGLRFKNAYTQATCSPTRASILTGLLPTEHQVGEPNNTLADSHITLPRLFENANSGYALASYGKWHLGGGSSGALDIGGWKEYSGFNGGFTDYTGWTPITNGKVESSNSDYITTELASKASSFIQAQDAVGKPWLCWLAFNAPHAPYHEPPANLLQSDWDNAATTDRDLYEKMLEAADTEIGNVLANVDLTKTTVILLGDNGTPQIVAQDPYADGHAKGTMYDGGGHVPMVIAGTSVKSRGVSHCIVHCVDLYATIAEIAGIKDQIPADTATSSKSFHDELSSEQPNDTIAVMEAFGSDVLPGRALRAGDYRLLIFDDPTTTSDTPTYEAYNVSNDLAETDNLLGKPFTAETENALTFLAEKSNSLAGGYDPIDFSKHTIEQLFIELPSSGVKPRYPRLINDLGNEIHPSKITVGGIEIGYAARENAAGETDRYWISAFLDPNLFTSGTHSIIVEYADTPLGVKRTYTALNSYVKP